MTLSVSSDDSTPIRKIVASLQDHLVEGTLLAAFVVWFFLRNFRSTLIIATAIPVSLLGAIAAMFFLGLTFNQMSLLGLLLLIGVVVDDAIVVLENIYRRHEHSPGIDRYTAAIEGTQQVGFAVIAASLTLVSIFGSVLFLEGIVARFFQSFAVVVTVGVLVSLFVSLTLTPMLCSRFLDVRPKRGACTTGWGACSTGWTAATADCSAGCSRTGARCCSRRSRSCCRAGSSSRGWTRTSSRSRTTRASWSASGRRSARAAPRWRNSSRSWTP